MAFLDLTFYSPKGIVDFLPGAPVIHVATFPQLVFGQEQIKFLALRPIEGNGQNAERTATPDDMAGHTPDFIAPGAVGRTSARIFVFL